MSTPYEISLSAQPQQFQVSLGGVLYTLFVRWCPPASAWMLDIYASDGITAIVTGCPLVTGTDLLVQYAYLGIKGKLVVQSDVDVNLVPAFDELGVSGHLYFLAN
jgi:hypothetical protein